MTDASQDTHHQDELYSDLDVLVEMVKDARADEQTVGRHLESLKTKLDHFVHRRADSAADS